MTPREAAKALIRHYVVRGDELSWLKTTMMGHYGPDYAAHIGGGVRIGDRWRELRPDQIAVEKIGGQPCAEVFSLRELYAEIKAEHESGLVQRGLFEEVQA